MIRKRAWIIITILFLANLFYMPFSLYRYGDDPLFIKGLLFLTVASSIGLYTLYTCYFFFRDGGSDLDWSSFKPGFHGIIIAATDSKFVVQTGNAFYIINIDRLGNIPNLIVGKNMTKGINGEIILSDSAVTIKK